MGQPRPLFNLFYVFSNKHHYNFTTNQCEKMSIQLYGTRIGTYELSNMSGHP